MDNGWTERIEELEAEVAKLTAERDADRRREYGYSQQTVDALTVERDKLEAENQRLREELDLVISFIPNGWGMPLGFKSTDSGRGWGSWRPSLPKSASAHDSARRLSKKMKR